MNATAKTFVTLSAAALVGSGIWYANKPDGAIPSDPPPPALPGGWPPGLPPIPDELLPKDSSGKPIRPIQPVAQPPQ